MSKSLKLNLSASGIKQAVKADSYITGLVDKASDMVKNASLASTEQVGDEAYHEAKLYRTMRGALSKLEASMAEYVETSAGEASISDNLNSQSETFYVEILVGDRLSEAFATPLAHLAEEYIINAMLYYWWQSIKPELAKDYLAFANDNILDIRRCLAKCAPTSSAASYDDISGSVISLLPILQAKDVENSFFAYIRSTVHNHKNPIVWIQNSNGLKVSVVDGEHNLDGTLFVYDENNKRTLSEAKDSTHQAAEISEIENEAIRLLSELGITAVAGPTESFDDTSSVIVTRRLN